MDEGNLPNRPLALCMGSQGVIAFFGSAIGIESFLFHIRDSSADHTYDQVIVGEPVGVPLVPCWSLAW